MHPCNHCSTADYNQDLETPRCPSIHAWIQKAWCDASGILLGHKNDKIPALVAAGVILECISLCEVSQGGNMFCLISLIGRS